MGALEHAAGKTGISKIITERGEQWRRRAKKRKESRNRERGRRRGQRTVAGVRGHAALHVCEGRARREKSGEGTEARSSR
jgi:hypothetical protein